MFYLEHVIELLFGAGLLLNSVLFLPQAQKLYRAKNSDGVSAITFAGFGAMQIVTILHGYIRKDYILMFGTIPSLVFCGLVTFFIFLYKK